MKHNLLKFKPRIRMAFFQKLLFCWDFPQITISRVYSEWSNNEKISSELHFFGGKSLVEEN